jgi:hypothetical protein
MKQSFLVSLAILTAAAAQPTAAGQSSSASDPQEFARLQTLIKPASDEAQWSQVSWMPSSNLWAARQKAAAEGKPLFLWYMAGEPLGTC